MDATYVACIDLCGKLVHSVMSVSRVFFLGKSQPPRAFPLLEDSEFFLMLSLLVILRSCISTLKVLNCDLEDHLKSTIVSFLCRLYQSCGPPLRRVVAHDPGTPNENIGQNHLNIALLKVF